MKALALSLALLLIAGCAGLRMKSSPRTDKFDQEFLEWMGDHLMHDLRNASACHGKHIRAELATFCADLLRDQTQEKERIDRMLKGWYRHEVHREPYPLWLESQDGRVFEEKFLEGVLRNHSEGAERAKECTSRAKHSELAQLCQEAAEHRAQEAAKMKKWNCEWFGHC